MKVLVGSRNPVKVAAVEDAFGRYFDEVDVVGIAVPSAVAAQPVGDETFAGAENRALTLARLNTEQGLGASYMVGIEGGILRLHGRWFALGAICIVDDRGRIGYGTSPQFELPVDITTQLLGGVELGDVIDRLTGEHNTKHKGGAVAFLTHGRLDRKNLYVQGLVVALVPFLNEKLFFR